MKYLNPHSFVLHFHFNHHLLLFILNYLFNQIQTSNSLKDNFFIHLQISYSFIKFLLTIILSFLFSLSILSFQFLYPLVLNQDLFEIILKFKFLAYIKKVNPRIHFFVTQLPFLFTSFFYSYLLRIFQHDQIILLMILHIQLVLIINLIFHLLFMSFQC